MTRSTLAFFAVMLSIAPAFGQTVIATSEYVFKGYTGVGRNDGSLAAGGTLVDRQNPMIVYGTTDQGGAYNAGAVYEVIGAPGAKLHDKIIYSFKANPDLGGPTGRLYQSPDGALYGATIAGGPYNNGGIFKLTPPAQPGGAWTETILHTYSMANGANFNMSALVGDGHGNIYGTAFIGRGSVFQIRADDSYHEIHAFSGPDGQGTTSAVTITPAGVLLGVTGYGGTYSCGGYGCGTIYALTPSNNSHAWQFATVYDFNTGAGGHLPFGPLALDPSGAIYGTNFTKHGSVGGVIFKVIPASGSQKAVATVAFNFTGQRNPFNGIAFDSDGGIYTTYFAGYNQQIEAYLPPTAPGSYQYAKLVDLLVLRGQDLISDGVALHQYTSTKTVLLDDVQGAGRNRAVNGVVIRLLVQPK